MASGRDASPWQDPTDGARRDEMLSPSTQVVVDREDYLGQGRQQVGRRISNDQVELFASTDVAGVLQVEFSQHTPLFAALHDVGTTASLRLLTSVAGAFGTRMQRLSIRRHGHGIAMAVLQFVEVPLADGTRIRIYSTDVQGDGPTRAGVAHMLLAFSRLGVMLMGGGNPTALSPQLQPLADAIVGGPWPNRELLMVPLGSGVALAAHASQLGGLGRVAVHVTPGASKTRQAWNYISGAWNRLHGGPGGMHALRTDFETPPKPPAPSAAAPAAPADAPSQGISLRALLPRNGLAASTPSMPWQAYVDSCSLLKGTVACCVFDTLSMQPLAHTGPGSKAAALAEQGAKLLRGMGEATRALGIGNMPVDGTVTVANHHLLVRPVPGHAGVAMHLVLASTTNLTLAKMQLDRITPPPAGGAG